MSDLQISLPDTLHANEVSQLLDVFAETFSGKPSFRHMFRKSATRVATTRWVGSCKWRLFERAYRIVLAKDRGQVVGFSLWLPPGSRWPSLLQELQAGFYRAPLVAGIAGTRRMLGFAAQETAITRQHAIEAQRWILDVIAVSSSAQRQGLGGRLMAPMLDTMAKNGAGCFVLTRNERNVAFYRKYGFSSVVTEEIGDTGIVAYGLCRDP
ncbi:MAG: GNAT family N-acetyltransferase [Nannocystaceae bacterium]